MKDITRVIRSQAPRSQFREHSAPLYLTSSFVFDSAEQGRAMFAEELEGDIYSRLSNPNVNEFIDKMVYLEKAQDGFAFASGMAAIFASMAALLNAGDHVLASRSLFGSSHQILTQILPRWGIEHSFVDATAPETWEHALRKNTRMLYLETPSNPGLDLIDLEPASRLAKQHDLILNVDNCFATPILQNPIQYGADLVSHSATKYLDGQGRVIGGIVVGQKELINKIRFFARHTGPSLSPFHAWLLCKSLETLSLRMERHCSNALTLAQHFAGHADLETVKYPYLPTHPQFQLAAKQMRAGGGIVTMTVKGGLQRGHRFIDALQLASISANLGDTRTIVTHPATTTHSKLTEQERNKVGITQGLIRISVGLEEVQDIIADIEQALFKSGS